MKHLRGSGIFAELRPNSFTLVELLVVVSIIGLLAALAVPVTQKAIAAGKTGKANGNLRQIGTLLNSYAAENSGCLPVLLDWRQSWWPPWQYRLMESAGVAANWNRPLYLADWVYDPIIRDSQQHPYGGFGANDAIMLGVGAGDNRDCLVVFRNDRGTPLTAIGPLSKKVVVVSATDSQGSQFKSSWYFHGSEWVNAGSAYSGPKPDPRHGGKTLCLFADGHTELINTDRMSSADRRKYFLLPQFE